MEYVKEAATTTFQTAKDFVFSAGEAAKSYLPSAAAYMREHLSFFIE